MQSLHSINAKADVISSLHALAANITAAKGIMNVLKTNLGPNGTLKMLVGGAGQIKLTKDGNVLLKEMQIQHPTASLIARTAVAQDDVTGDGTTSVVLLAGELLRQAERYVHEGLHPRILVEGMELARDETIKYLDVAKIPINEFVDKSSSSSKSEEKKPEIEYDVNKRNNDLSRELLRNVARTSLRTKLSDELADHLTDIVVDAVLTVRNPNHPNQDSQIDLHMVEIMIMQHKSEFDTKLVRGLVLDHGARHPNMSKRSENCFILTANIGLEWEKTEVNSAFFYSSAEQREKLVASERKHVNDKVQSIIALKNKVCGDDLTKSFVCVNQQGIDPISLDLLQKNNIIGIRRAKKRNMERIPLACGGYAINSDKDLIPECLGHADLVYEHVLGEDKFTFIEGVKNAFSCTILIRGPNRHSINQIKDAIRDGLRAVKNTIVDNDVILGAGCFEVQAYENLMKFKKTVDGRKKLGIQAFADALLAIPRTLANNAGHDQQELLIKLLQETEKGKIVGLDLETGDLLDPKQAGIFDNYCVKKQFLHLGSIIASKLLLVDEIMRAGRSMGKKQ
eukprot:CAMPEP_0201567036 /NCGR_PEP_ID=MMETSP0190_2-20130828/7291_1 /ASSEMBLY_ACC=CAM_ASM_000263 /TAXON_ID=37353 /ORGANISM="Rosalina sp." /LENGTH=566 /DNA_ID=CAMNT_0047986533 /DNA_START=100 /DNA_END=1803 /DNA_ORIENTATION=+